MRNSTLPPLTSFLFDEGVSVEQFLRRPWMWWQLERTGESDLQICVVLKLWSKIASLVSLTIPVEIPRWARVIPWLLLLIMKKHNYMKWETRFSTFTCFVYFTFCRTHTKSSGLPPDLEPRLARALLLYLGVGLGGENQRRWADPPKRESWFAILTTDEWLNYSCSIQILIHQKLSVERIGNCNQRNREFRLKESEPAHFYFGDFFGVG